MRFDGVVKGFRLICSPLLSDLIWAQLHTANLFDIFVTTVSVRQFGGEDLIFFQRNQREVSIEHVQVEGLD
jgi:hypothetical protein